LPDPQYSLAAVMKTMVKTADQFRREQAVAAVRWYSLWRAPLLARLATLALVMVVLWWGAGTASSNAVPGEWLYPVKLLTERVKFFLTINAEDKAELRLVFSDERLKEAVQKIERGEGFDRRLLDEMLDEAKQAVQASATLPEFNRKLLASRAAHASEFQRDALDRVKDRMPAQQRETVIRYMDMCGDRAGWMRQMPAQEDQRHGDEQPERHWQRWMDMCPD